MKTLALENGDLVVTSSGHATVTGGERVKLDLTLALAEPVGNDRFHPKYGTYAMEFIGDTMSAELQQRVEAEIIRVIDNYIATQQAEVLNDYTAARRSRFSTADVVQAITGVQVQSVVDRIYIKVSLMTQARQQVTITKSVSV